MREAEEFLPDFVEVCSYYFHGELELSSITGEIHTQVEWGKIEHAIEVFTRVCELLKLEVPDCVADGDLEEHKCFLACYLYLLSEEETKED